MTFTYKVLPLAVFIFIGCTNNDVDSLSSDPIDSVSESIQEAGTETIENSSDQKVELQANAQNEAGISTDGDKIVISFDEISADELLKNTNSNDGKGRKLPLVFTEDGIEWEISNVFTLDPELTTNPTSSAPYSLAGNPASISLKDGSTFNIESVMFGVWEAPAKVRVYTMNGKEEVFNERIEVNWEGLQKLELNLENVTSLGIWGGSTYGVIDDMTISR